MKKDLAGVDRSKTPWIIFGGHRPMYISSNYGGPGVKIGADINVMNLMVRSTYLSLVPGPSPLFVEIPRAEQPVSFLFNAIKPSSFSLLASILL